MQQVKKAHRRHAAKASGSSAQQLETVQKWLDFVAGKQQGNEEREAAEFQYCPLIHEAVAAAANQ